MMDEIRKEIRNIEESALRLKALDTGLRRYDVIVGFYSLRRGQSRQMHLCNWPIIPTGFAIP